MSEKTDAIKLANKILEDAGRDPDDDLSMMSRQFLRALEMVEAMHKQLQDVDWEGKVIHDLVQSNRDEILKKHEEAIRRIHKVLVHPGKDDRRCYKIQAIVSSLWLFHPMHGESWSGWPEGTE